MNIKEMEQFINQVKSVISSKIVIDNESNIEEIHVLSNTNRGPKQISRDIQTILVSKFGVDIDYKKISIAQIDEGTVDGSDFRLRLGKIEYTTSGNRTLVKVVLEKDDKFYEGEVSGISTLNNSRRMLVSATLKAVEKFIGIEDNLIYEDVKVINLAGKEAVITAVVFLASFGEQLLSGCAFVNRDMKEAIVKSTLDAVNRVVVKYFSES